MDNAEHILEAPKDKDIDTLGRAIMEAIIDAQNAILRRHIETLVNLINFSNFDRCEAYRIYLNAENLDHFLGRQSDFETFYESKSGNIDSSIKDFSDRIEKDLKNLGIPKIWFLKKDWAGKKSPTIFESIRKRFMEALPYASDSEKIPLGLSYNQFFAKFSASVHASAGSRTSEMRQQFSDIEKNISFISLLGQHIITRANMLMGIEDPNDHLQRNIREGYSNAAKLIQPHRKIFRPGDIVLAMGDICEILECKQSRYGYTTCRIKFLTRPPLPETPDDWLPAGFVAMVLPRDKLRQFLFKNQGKPDWPKEMQDAYQVLENQPDDKLAVYVKKAIVRLYKDGILIPMLQRSGVIRDQSELENE